MRSDHSYGGSSDEPLAALAARQHGVVALTQLRVLGYSDRMVDGRIARRRLHCVHRGVYAVGHPALTLRGRWLAAVMACGTGAALSHGASAALHDLRPVPSGPIDVTAGRRRIADGVRCHASRRYATTRVDAIPVTTIEQTALDLAETLAGAQLRSLLEAIERRDRFDLGRFEALIAASPGRRGLTRLREALAELTDDAPWTQSQLELAFLELVREHGFPEPHANVVVAGRLVDFHWPDHGVVVELDGWRFHKSRRAFEGDRRGDTRLIIAGCRPIRVTQQRVTAGRLELVDDLTQLLSDAP